MEWEFIMTLLIVASLRPFASYQMPLDFVISAACPCPPNLPMMGLVPAIFCLLRLCKFLFFEWSYFAGPSSRGMFVRIAPRRKPRMKAASAYAKI